MDRYYGKSNEEDAKYLVCYINDVLTPASDEFFSQLAHNKVMLHNAYSFNTISAHAIDYMLFIAKKND